VQVAMKQAQAFLLSFCVLSATLSSSAWAQKPSRSKPEPTYTVGSNELDIVKFVQTVAAATGKTMIVDPAVKGKVRIMTNNNAMTADELYDLFRAVLQLSNFTVVEVGDVVKVVPLKEARTSPVGEASAKSRLEEIVTDVIVAENISAAKLLAALRPMVSTSATLSHHDGSNSIIITDTKANIDRIRRVINKIDTSAVPTTELFQLKFADAETVVQTITQLDGTKKSEAGLSNKLQLVADKRNNAILISGEDLSRERVKGLMRMLDRPAAQTGNVRVIYLEYADATKVAETLTKNTLLAVVERLDIRRAQVLVEAIIVELDITEGQELGTEWLFADTNEGVFGAGPRGSSTGSGAIAAAALQDDVTFSDLGTAIGGLSNTALGIAGGVDSSRRFLALINALDNSTKANILSTPTLLTMDNNEAEINVGEEVPFQTGSFTNNNGNVGNPFTTFQRENVGILLKVTPQVNEGDKILLNIDQEVSAVTETASNGGIITSKNRIATQIMADDGEIVVLGGLMQENSSDIKNKVPVLGSIPILGYLFKYQQTRISKSNLMVFLRAKIVRDDDVMSAATAEKYRNIRDKQIEMREQGLPLMKDLNIPVLPEEFFEQESDLNSAEQTSDEEDERGE